MGAWDVGSFSNDDAIDWVADLSSDPSVDLVSTALSKFTSADNLETEGPECSIALAPAEVVAPALGKPIDYFPEELKVRQSFRFGLFGRFSRCAPDTPDVCFWVIHWVSADGVNGEKSPRPPAS